MLVIFTFMLYFGKETHSMKKACEKDERAQSQWREELASLPMRELTMADNATKSNDSIRYCSDKDTIASMPVPCSDEELMSDENLMANSSLIMLAQNNRD